MKKGKSNGFIKKNHHELRAALYMQCLVDNDRKLQQKKSKMKTFASENKNLKSALKKALGHIRARTQMENAGLQRKCDTLERERNALRGEIGSQSRKQMKQRIGILERENARIQRENQSLKVMCGDLLERGKMQCPDPSISVGNTLHEHRRDSRSELHRQSQFVEDIASKVNLKSDHQPKYKPNKIGILKFKSKLEKISENTEDKGISVSDVIKEPKRSHATVPSTSHIPRNPDQKQIDRDGVILL